MCPERSPSLERPQSIGSCIVTKRDGSVVSRQPLSVVTRARVHDEPHSPRARSALAPWCVVAARVVGARSLGCSAFGCMIWSGSPSNVLPLSLARTNDARSLRWSHAVRCRHACGAATSCRNATWLMVSATRITVVILELIRATNPDFLEGTHLLDKRSTRALPVALMIHDNSTDRTAIVLATHHSNFCPINFRW